MTTVPRGHEDPIHVCIDLQRVENARLIDEHLRLGEDLSKPRLVAHSARFLDELSAIRAAGQLHRLGFTTDVVPHDEQWHVSFVRSSVLSPASINLITRTVVQIVLAEGGSYEGWMAGPCAT